VTTFVARRLLALIPLVLIISFLVFGLVLLLGNPAREIAGGTTAQESRVKQVARGLHLEEPFFQRYGHWLGDAVRGDLGKSLFDDQPVATEIKTRFPVTFSMALGGVALSLLIGVPLGIAAGMRPGSWIDRFATFGSSFGIAMPDFWLAIILVILLAVNRSWLPAIRYVSFSESPVEWAKHLLMPWIALGLGGAAVLMRQLRGALVDVLDQDYIRTARANGLPTRSIIGKHALKNAAVPATTILGIQIAYLLGGTFIMERIFAINGLGQYALNAVVKKDLPVIQGVVLVFALTFVVMNLLVDVVYAFLNPKVRLQ
jgi:peptide/nickel transport system permease protein